MNDFFSVLDDFELEEFVAPSGDSDDDVSFSMDTATDGTGGSDVPIEEEKELDEIKTDGEQVTKEDVENGTNVVWEKGDNPFSNSTTTAGVYLTFSGTAEEKTNTSGQKYYEVSLSLVSNIHFTESVSTGDGLVINRTNIGMHATAGVKLNVSSGHITGGVFNLGTGRFAIGTPGAALANDQTVIAINGFEDSAVEFDGHDNNLTVVNTNGDTNGTLTITGDNDFYLNGTQVKLSGIAETDQQSYSLYYDDDGHLVLDLSEVAVAEDSTLRVISAGGAAAIIPPTDETEIRIGSLTYTYANAQGNAEFLVDGTDVTGFVLANTNDAITVNKNDSINIYASEDTTTALAVTSGQGYTVTKLGTDRYQIVVENASEFTIGETKLAFNITSATRNSDDFNGVTILFNGNSEITAINGLEDFTSAKDTMEVEGADVYDERGGLLVDGAYISISTGDFIYAGGDEHSVTVAEDVQVFSVNGTKLIYVDDDGGTVKDNDGDEFEYSGKGYLIGENEEITGFTFVAEGDKITLPTEDAITVFYNGAAIDVPAVTDSDGEFTLTKTKDGFRISGLEAGAVVNDGEGDGNDEYTFTNAGGTVDFDANGNITGIGGYVGDLALTEKDSGLTINGDTLTFDFADDDQTVTAAVETGGVTSVTGLNDGDTISSTNNKTVFDFNTDSTDDDFTDIFTVNDKVFTVVGDNNNISITAGGVVTGLDQDAYMYASAGAISVNGAEYSAEDIATANETGEKIIGFETKAGDESSFVTDAVHPIFNPTTTIVDIRDEWLKLEFADGQTFRETEVANVEELDRRSDADTISSQVYLDGVDPNATVSTYFNNAGDNLAIVTDNARGTKNIFLGDRGDAVIMMGEDEYGTVSITGGKGNDTIFVGGRSAEDVVVHEGSMKTIIDLSAGGVDKIHTYAAANANIVLNNYDETKLGGVVVHDPEVPYIKNLTDAIKDDLIVVDGDAIVAIDRDETTTGVDRKTRIEVNNASSAHQSMIRLFGYKDNKDTYGDDYGQLLGFTGSEGGILDASDLKEDVVLIGNKDNAKTVGSALVGTDYDDTVFAGAYDSVNAGAGSNLIVLDDTIERDGAMIVLGAGNNSIENLQSGFDGDVLDITAISGRASLAFADGTLAVFDPTTKTITTATDPYAVDEEFIEVNLVDGSDTLKAAVAEVGGAIKVTDEDVPNYYVAENAAIDFSSFNDNVLIDVDGDWEENNFVGDTNITLGSGFDTLIGGKGMTLFKGGKDDETLVAGTGESSLYGAGGKNVLVGSTGNDDKVGSTEFFVIGINNGAQNTIQGFEFIENGGSNQATFDNLNLGMSDGNDVTDIQVEGNNVVVAVKGAESGALEKVTIEGAAGKEMLVDRGTQTETVAQIAATEVTVNNSYVDFYAATDDANGATVKVGNVESTEIWLGGPPIDHDKAVPEFTSSKFTVIDASGSAAEVLMAGNELANTIVGGTGTASMWGGYGNANDVMVAGTGHNEFYYEIGNGNDTIVGTNEGDIIHLGATLDQIDFDGTYMEGSAIVVKFTDGGQLNIENSSTDVNFSFDDGTNVKANRTTGQFE